MITIFENFNKEKIKKVGNVVFCIKDYITKTTSFKKDKYYQVDGLTGDPEKAQDEGFDYLPLKYTTGVILLDDNNNIVRFKIEFDKYQSLSKYPDFFKYFEIPESVIDAEKYNI